MKPEACALISSTASPVFNKFMKQRNEKIKNVACIYDAAHALPVFFSITKTFYKTRDL